MSRRVPIPKICVSAPVDDVREIMRVLHDGAKGGLAAVSRMADAHVKAIGLLAKILDGPRHIPEEPNK